MLSVTTEAYSMLKSVLCKTIYVLLLCKRQETKAVYHVAKFCRENLPKSPRKRVPLYHMFTS